eukprot:353683-Chlamydomonas_euryale.AAC.2
MTSTTCGFFGRRARGFVSARHRKTRRPTVRNGRCDAGHIARVRKLRGPSERLERKHAWPPARGGADQRRTSWLMAGSGCSSVFAVAMRSRSCSDWPTSVPA